MPISTSKQTSPSDFVILDSYENPNKEIVEGEFPIYITGASQCCIDINGYVKSEPITIPQP
jgi:hypothetical protein